MAGPAYAQAIGDASFVRKDVRSIMAGRLMPLNTGDTVYRDQIIRTAADSSTVLVFRDKSSMAIGPLSEVRLDEFVFKASAGP
ncbi:MAG: FecR domain-containing protein, partial [Alsobacter sp.]